MQGEKKETFDAFYQYLVDHSTNGIVKFPLLSKSKMRKKVAARKKGFYKFNK